MKRKKLKLDKETLLVLESDELGAVAGGGWQNGGPILSQQVCGGPSAICPTHLPCPNMTTTCLPDTIGPL